MKKTEPKSQNEDRAIDLTLRPERWDDYVGQEKIKDSLKVILAAAKKRKEVSDHLLFSGPAGLGKTTLAYLVARELGGMIKTTSGPALEKSGDLAAVLTNLSPGEILIHRRSASHQSDDRGGALSRDGGAEVASRGREGTVRADVELGPSAVHFDRRDDAGEFVVPAASLPFRRDVAFELL